MQNQPTKERERGCKQSGEPSPEKYREHPSCAQCNIRRGEPLVPTSVFRRPDSERVTPPSYSPGRTVKGLHRRATVRTGQSKVTLRATVRTGQSKVTLRATVRTGQ